MDTLISLVIFLIIIFFIGSVLAPNPGMGQRIFSGFIACAVIGSIVVALGLFVSMPNSGSGYGIVFIAIAAVGSALASGVLGALSGYFYYKGKESPAIATLMVLFVLLAIFVFNFWGALEHF
jgi:hypothetical protein